MVFAVLMGGICSYLPVNNIVTEYNSQLKHQISSSSFCNLYTFTLPNANLVKIFLLYSWFGTSSYYCQAWNFPFIASRLK